MKTNFKNYVPITLDQYINESKSITLKRGYRGQNPVVVGANAPVRNQILSYVAEGVKVGASDLKKFIAGLNETNANPNAAANMWLRRNGKFFVTESKGSQTFFKLSTLGQRLVNSFVPTSELSEGEEGKSDKKVFEKKKYDFKVNEDWIQKLKNLLDEKPEIEPIFQERIEELRAQYPDFDEQLGEVSGKDKYVPELEELVRDLGAAPEEGDQFRMRFSESLQEKKKYDFKDPKTGEAGIYDEEDEDIDETCSKTHENCTCGCKEGEKCTCNETNESVEIPKKAKANLGGKLDPKLHNLLSKDQNKDEDEIKGFTKEISENDESGISEERKARIEAIIENIKSRTEKPINEAEEEKEEEKEEEVADDASDELSFDDLDLSGEDGEKAKGEDDEKAEGEEADAEDKDADVDAEGDDEYDEKVEITEFIITVDDVDSAIAELEELGVDAEKVIDTEAGGSIDEAEDVENAEGGEDPESGDDEAGDGLVYKDNEISVDAEDWDNLRGWLEDKGVDVEEMFGGEIEVEDVDDDEDPDAVDLEDADVDLEGDGDVDLDLALDGEGGEGSEELELEVDPGEDVEESVTGMEKEEEEQTPNLFKTAKEITFRY